MRNISCVVVDDEPLAIRLLETFIKKTPGLDLTASFTDSIEAISFLKANHVDLVFLDIQMPDINGMELAHNVSSPTRIVFTTAFKEYAFDSYEVSALDFLLKPIRYGKFLAAVEKARQWFDLTELESSQQEIQSNSPIRDTVFIKVDGEYRQIPIANIIYVSGMKDYVRFYLEGERLPLTTHLTMKAVEDMLPSSQFMRVHRSYVVALAKIRTVDRNGCIYIGDEIIRVTDAYKDTFEKYLNPSQR